MQIKQLSFTDRLIEQIDTGVKTLTKGAHQAARAMPKGNKPTHRYEPKEQQHIAGLMRINHTGEVCAQALYQGQALTAKTAETRAAMQHAADEEIDHLAWCEDRLEELGSRPSIFNPVWYAGSFAIGALAGAIGDKWSLGFVEETEKQVVEHIQSHLDQLPTDDKQTRAILEQMQIDEEEHGDMAHQAGAAELPLPIRGLMKLTSKVMTKTSYWV